MSEIAAAPLSKKKEKTPDKRDLESLQVSPTVGVYLPRTAQPFTCTRLVGTTPFHRTCAGKHSSFILNHTRASIDGVQQTGGAPSVEQEMERRRMV